MSEPLFFPFAAPPPPGEAIEVAPGIHWLRMPLPFALDHINLWLVGAGDDVALVDCGYGDAPTRELWSRHFATTLGGRAPARIVVTHYHPDHVGNAAWLAQRFALPVWMSAAEFLTAHAVRAEGAGHALADTCALFRAHGVEDDHIAALEARGNAYARGVPALPASFRRLFPGSAYRLGATEFRVIAGYGHSPEHAALYSDERRVLISGDMLLPKISTNVAVWPVEPDADALARFLDSLAAFESLPADTLVLPSHGLPFRGLHARVEALRAHHRDRLAELTDAVRQSGGAATAADVVPVLFRRELDLQQRFFAIGEAIAHLNHLAAGGRLVRETAGSGRVRFSLPPEAAPA
jgi:glyoxylase-like metal-dependent hydrolase (beta-lactamase superfamily II)